MKKMKKVIFKTPYEYCDFMCESITNEKDVKIISPIYFSKKNIEGLYLHFLMHINKKRFYKRLVERFVVKDIKEVNEDICFISFDSSEWTGTEEFVDVLKKIYPNSKTAIIIYNSIQGNCERARHYTEQFDYCFSFDPYDSELYGWHYFFGLMPLQKRKKTLKKYDICFIGNEKGRYQKLKNIYCLLTESGFKCYFHITSKIAPRDDIDRAILFSEGLSFGETIEIEASSNCVLDLTNVEKSRQGVSLRILEAVYCNSKIITNNIYIQENPLLKEISVCFEDLPNIEQVRGLLRDESIEINPSDLGVGFNTIFDFIARKW